MSIYQLTAGRQQRIPITHSAATTALTLGSFTLVAYANGAEVTDPTTDWTLTLSEIEASNLPGYYELRVTPPEEGLLVLSVTEGAYSEDLVFQVAHEALDLLGATKVGSEGDYVLTVTDEDADVVEGALVRVYDSSGSKMIAKATTDALGEVTLGLPVGSYEVRSYKDGYDFSAQNPTTITVVANANVAPVLSEIVPAEASLGSPLALAGLYFGLADSQVLFGATLAASVEVSVKGKVAVVVIPVSLTDTVVNVKIRKPDPDNEGEYLTSAAQSLVIS
jgi:hypothetical protein